MSNQIRTIVKTQLQKTAYIKKITLRKHLNADALFATLRSGFEKIPDHRPGTVKHTLPDSLMSGLAMFSLKDPSLLAFDGRRSDDHENLKTIFGMNTIPCDTSMREILDPVCPEHLRPLFKDCIRPLQRGKVLEKMLFMGQGYLLNLDGTGYFSSNNRYSPACLERKSRSGEITYHLQAVGAAVVHPAYKEVIALCPEVIRRQDGSTKMDCERNAIKRMLVKLRQDHPHMKFIVNEDSLASNAPHIRDLQEHDFRFILGAKESDHKSLFEFVDQAVKDGRAVELVLPDEKKEEITHCFRIVSNAPLNKSNQDIRVTFVEYWEDNPKRKKTLRFSWITDLPVTVDNVYEFMCGARARWKIENETFNTLKNQGYQFGHSFGLGKEHLSEVFVHLMMLAFLVDQIQQLCCPLFNTARKLYRTRRSFWEKVRWHFYAYVLNTMEELYYTLLLVRGHHSVSPVTT